MSTQEILIELQKLPLPERLTVIEQLTRGMRDELQAQQRKSVPVGELRGIAKPVGAPPTDEEIKEDYTRYLMEKYS